MSISWLKYGCLYNRKSELIFREIIFTNFFVKLISRKTYYFFPKFSKKKVLPKVVSNILAIWDFKVDFYTDRPTPVICILGSILNQNIYPHENVSILLFLQQHFAKKKNNFFFYDLCVCFLVEFYVSIWKFLLASLCDVVINVN